MRNARLLSVFLMGIFFGGCSMLPPGWKEYKAAVSCHIQAKHEECDKSYEAAIKKNFRLTGVHSSYGTHLLARGESQRANEQFDIEVKNHPISEKAVLLLTKSGRVDSVNTQEVK